LEQKQIHFLNFGTGGISSCITECETMGAQLRVQEHFWISGQRFGWGATKHTLFIILGPGSLRIERLYGPTYYWWSHFNKPVLIT